MRYIATIGDQQHSVVLQENGHSEDITLDERELTLDWRLIGQPYSSSGGGSAHFSLLINGRSYEAWGRILDPHEAGFENGMAVEVVVRGQTWIVHVRDERSQALASIAGGAHAAGDAVIRAPMPGMVSNILVQEGDEVSRGQTIVVLEAMKMENDLTTPRAGIVKTIRTAKGQTVNQGETLAVIGESAGVAPPDGDEDE